MSERNPNPPSKSREKTDRRQRYRFCQLSLKDLLALLFGAAVPLGLAIYTIVIAEQKKRLAGELRQQRIYDEFLDDIYKLNKLTSPNESNETWIFMNARYLAAHRQWDSIRKQNALQFLKEKRFIGANVCRDSINSDGKIVDIINLERLNFDGIVLESSKTGFYRLDMTGIVFHQVSLSRVKFNSIDLRCAEFHLCRLTGASFGNASLVSVIFNETQLNDTDFGNADLHDAKFYGIDLRKTLISPSQINEANFFNCTMPNGTTSKTVQTTRSTGTLFS